MQALNRCNGIAEGEILVLCIRNVPRNAAYTYYAANTL